MHSRTKLLLSLSAILITAFVTTSLINYEVTRKAIREELLHSSLPLTGKNIYSEIHSAMMRPILVSSSMANDTFLKSWVSSGEHDVSEIQGYLREIQKQYGFMSTFFVSHVTDNYYTPKGILKKVGARDPHDVWFYAFTRSHRKYDLDVDTNQAEDNRLTIFVNFRLEDDKGRLLGVTGAGVDMRQATELLQETQEKYHRNVYLVDQDGLVQVHLDKSLIETRYITETEGIRKVADGILSNHDRVINTEYDRDGRHILLSSRYIPEFKWHLIVEQDEGEALSTARANLIRTLGVGFVASLLIIWLCWMTINRFQARLERMAKTDSLTGVANRWMLEERFSLAAYKAVRYGQSFSVLVIDLDDFKAVNDKLGHTVGDRVLKTVADALQRTIRPADLVARWGGDEFLLLMDGSAQDAQALFERLRATIAKAATDTPIRFSCGIAQFEPGDDLGSLTQRADQAMYQAKGGDGECIIC